MKAIWKGSINFGLVNIPVKLYSAVEQSSLDLDMVDRRDMAKVHFKRVNEHTGNEIDGYRMITTVQDGKIEMISRNGKSFNEIYTELEKELRTIGESVILDGEVVIENSKGISDFQLLQNYRTTKIGKLKYYVFDLLYLNGHFTTDFPLVKRKELMDAFFKMYQFKNIFNAPYQTGKGKALFQKFSEAGYEGIIAKAPGSVYEPDTRSDAWLKVKSSMTQEAIICGYTLPQRSRKHFGSLIRGGRKIIFYSGLLSYLGISFFSASIAGFSQGTANFR